MWCCKENDMQESSKPQTYVISPLSLSHHELQWCARFKFSQSEGSYQSKTDQVHILVQGWNGNITTEIYDSNIKKTRTCLLNECFHRWKWRIPASFLPRHQSGVTDVTRAVHKLLLWLMRSICRWFRLDPTLKLKAWVPDCDVLLTSARTFEGSLTESHRLYR